MGLDCSPSSSCCCFLRSSILRTKQPQAQNNSIARQHGKRNAKDETKARKVGKRSNQTSDQVPACSSGREVTMRLCHRNRAELAGDIRHFHGQLPGLECARSGRMWRSGWTCTNHVARLVCHSINLRFWDFLFESSKVVCGS